MKMETLARGAGLAEIGQIATEEDSMNASGKRTIEVYCGSTQHGSVRHINKQCIRIRCTHTCGSTQHGSVRHQTAQTEKYRRMKEDDKNAGSSAGSE
jgi:hypothetical protein